MLGAIIGDIVGSRFEWNNIKQKEFEFFTDNCHFTDDSVMTLAVICALKAFQDNQTDLTQQTISHMQKTGRLYPTCGYGSGFYNWLLSNNPQPYNSWGNGAAMRVSPCGFFGKNPTEVLHFARTVTEVTHNHPEGIKGAEATAMCVYLARTGTKISDIKKYIQHHYYPMDFTLDEIRPNYTFHVSCQKSVPQALEAFFESTGFEDAIRNAVSIGGDSDTIAAITGGIAEAYYGIPHEIKVKAYNYLDENFKNVLRLIYENKTITKHYFHHQSKNEHIR